METQNDDIPGPEWSKAQGKDPDKNANKKKFEKTFSNPGLPSQVL